MAQQQIEIDVGQIQLLLTSCLILMIGIAGFAHVVGGAAWSGRVVRLYWRVLRAMVGYPILWMGQLIGRVGTAIVARGGGRTGGAAHGGRRRP